MQNEYSKAIELLDEWIFNLSDEEIDNRAGEVRQVLNAIKLLETVKNED